MPLALEVRHITGPVVCGVDDSRSAPEVAAMAGALAVRLSCRLLLVHVVPGRGMSTFASPAGHDEAERVALLMLGRIAAHLPRESEQQVVEGNPGAELAAVAEREYATWLVVGASTRGPFASAVTGSVTGHLTRAAPCPLMVVSRAYEGPAALEGRCVLAGMRDDDDRGVAEVALKLAATLDLPLVVSHAIGLDQIATVPAAPGAVPMVIDRVRDEVSSRADVWMHRVVDDLLKHGSPRHEVRVDVVEGLASETLAGMVDRLDAAALVLGCRGRGRLVAALLGSVSGDLVRESPCPVVVCSPRARRGDLSG